MTANRFLLCFSEPVPPDEIEDVFSVEDYDVNLGIIRPWAFLLSTSLSFSKIKHTLSSYYSGELEVPVPPREYIVAKVPESAPPEACRFFGYPSEETLPQS